MNCIGFESSLTHCRHLGWGEGNCDPSHGEDAGVVCDNTTVEELSNNFCRKVNYGSCADLQVYKYTLHRRTDGRTDGRKEGRRKGGRKEGREGGRDIWTDLDG